MFGIILCVGCFLACHFLTRKSASGGLMLLLLVGYSYGILRANIAELSAQFVFDVGALGLYTGVLFQGLNNRQRYRIRPLAPWVLCLALWPTLLLLVPSQQLLVQLVGWRSAVLFVPLILIGGMLEENETYGLAKLLGYLNIIVLGVAIGEIVWGVAAFYPHSSLTEIIYRSRDVYVEATPHYRIPGTFTHSAVYATTMVSGLPLLSGGFSIARVSRDRVFFASAIFASVTGVFLSASRADAVILMLMFLYLLLIARLPRRTRQLWLMLAVLTIFLVALTPRMQRFLTLHNPTYIVGRASSSLNQSFFEIAVEYPLGNGLGGGGTSMPSFLQPLVKDPIVLENEYARVLAEQGLLGLLLWTAFLLWVIRRSFRPYGSWTTGRRLARLYCLLYFLAAIVGTGMFNAIPSTAILMVYIGWLSSRPFPPARVRLRRPSLSVRASAAAL